MVPSKKTHAAFVAVALLVAALLAAVAFAGRGDLPVADDNSSRCSRVGACSDTLCTEKCGVHDVGSCKFVGLFVYCCCAPVHPASPIDAAPPLLGGH